MILTFCRFRFFDARENTRSFAFRFTWQQRVGSFVVELTCFAVNSKGTELITDTCSNDNACDKYKLFLPTCNYVSSEYLAEEMQYSIDNFEKGVLKQANAHISVTSDVASQRMNISAQTNSRLGSYFQSSLVKS